MMLPHAGENFSLTDSVSGLLPITMRLLSCYISRCISDKAKHVNMSNQLCPLFKLDRNPKIDFYH